MGSASGMGCLARLQGGLVTFPLAGYHLHCGVGVDQPWVAPAGGAADGDVVVGGDPDRRDGAAVPGRVEGEILGTR